MLNYAFALDTFICGLPYLDEKEVGCIQAQPEDSDTLPMEKVEESVKVHYAESDYENQQEHGNADVPH